jgi:transposase
MVGRETGQTQLFASVPLESKIPADHPLRKLRLLVDECLKPWISAWESRYSDVGQPGIPPAQLIRAQLLMAFYSIKSERSLCEHIEFNYLFRWFVGLDWDDPVFTHSVFSKNRERLFGDGAAEALLGEVVRYAESKRLLASDRLVVDGTLIKAWASMKSFKADDGSEDDKPNFKGTKRSNKTHSSRTDADARLFRKGNGQESMLCHMGHILVDSVTGLIRACRVTHATGVGEVEAALSMAAEHLNPNQILVGDRLYDQQKFMDGARDLGVRAHPRAKSKGSRLSGQTTKSESYEASMKTRYIVERSFGWIKGAGRMRQTMLRGTEKVGWQFTLSASAMNLVRIANLTG